MYAFHAVQTSTDPEIQSVSIWLKVLFCFYATSIVIGRIYCGMHGLFDVIIGSLLGALITIVQVGTADAFDSWVTEGPPTNVVLVTLIVLILVRLHPEPADNCPCFDDSVAFAGVFVGVQLGSWQFSRSPYSSSDPVPATIPFSLDRISLSCTILRMVLGVLVIFTWRGVAKPTLLRTLPPIFRFIGTLGLLLPRKFFLNASQYSQVPTLRKDDNVIPPASDIPGMLNSLRHPRKRTISIGPQSEADAYEAMAFRERRRRESHGRTSSPPSPVREDVKEPPSGAATNGTPRDQPTKTYAAEAVTDEEDDEELFRKLLRPRVRYDVEVVTKLIVYSGIAYISLEVNPLLFEALGLAPTR